MHKPLLIQYFLHILLACSLQIHFPLLHAQEISVRPIPMLDKLPVKAIHRIFQDSEGYIWYGTFDGLCRYDGYDIKVYRSDLSNPNLLASNYITYIAEDHEKENMVRNHKRVIHLRQIHPANQDHSLGRQPRPKRLFHQCDPRRNNMGQRTGNFIPFPHRRLVGRKIQNRI